MYDAKGIILKQKSCRWHMTTIKSYSIQDLSLFFCKRTVPKLSKDKFCNLRCIVCHVAKKITVQHNILYSPLLQHTQNNKNRNNINNLTVSKQHH